MFTEEVLHQEEKEENEFEEKLLKLRAVVHEHWKRNSRH